MKNPTQRLRRVPALLTLLVLAILPFGLWTSTQAQVKKPITKEGLVEAVRLKGLTTKELIKQIGLRGVSFEMTAINEAELRGAGASPELIEAARANYRDADRAPAEQKVQFPKGSGLLIVYSGVSGCQVFLNGAMSGATSTDGSLRLMLKAGQYKVLVKKENFEDQEHTVVIAAGAEAVEPFTLTAIQGRLTVNPSVAGAQVTLNGTEHPEGIRDLSLPVQTYAVRVSKPGFRPFTQNVTLNPRGLAIVEATLQPIPVEEFLPQVLAHLQAKRYSEAISAGNEILVTYPDNGKANLLVGLAYYYSNQYSSSFEFLSKAISLGEQVVLPVKHHHTAFLSDDLCTGRLTVGQGTLAFSSADRGGHDFSVPAGKIYELTPEPRKFGRVHVRIGLQNGAKEDKKTYNFHVIQAFLVSANPNDPASIKFVRCGNCDDETALLYQLLKQLREAPPTPNRASVTNESVAAAPAISRPSQLVADNGAPGRPTLTRRPPNSGAAAEPTADRTPQLMFVGRESFVSGGRTFIRYKLTVANRTAYSDDLFAPAPDLPACGLNTKSSRTWVDIFDGAGKRLYGFCAISSASGLENLWFALAAEQAPPPEIYIVIKDRQASTEYRSNRIAIP